MPKASSIGQRRIQGRIYGWTGTKWEKITVDSSGTLVPSNSIGAQTVASVTDARVLDVMSEVLSELKIMNTHLQIITGEEINKDD